jgi:hypothetical protein
MKQTTIGNRVVVIAGTSHPIKPTRRHPQAIQHRPAPGRIVVIRNGQCVSAVN